MMVRKSSEIENVSKHDRLFNCKEEDKKIDGSKDSSQGSNRFLNMLESLVMNKSNQNTVSDEWKRDFSERPTWCDASISLQLIQAGEAKGNKVSLHIRSFIQKLLYGLGNFIQKHFIFTMLSITLLFSLCCFGLPHIYIETDIVKLWVTKGGRLEEELNFLSRIKAYNLAVYNSGDQEAGVDNSYQVFIQTKRYDSESILNKEELLEHLDLMTEIVQYNVEVDGVKWSLSDVCYKPIIPGFKNISLPSNYLKIIERILPCIWITPLDCFWEGSKPLGPRPPIESSSLGFFANFLSSLPKEKFISWSNMNPVAMINEIDSFFPLKDVKNSFQRANVGSGYLDRWCIDPLDYNCPPSAPNYYPFCQYLSRFLVYVQNNGLKMDIVSEFDKNSGMRINVEPLNSDSLAINIENSTDSPEVLCKKHRLSFAEWMRKNPNKWSDFLEEDELPKQVNYGKILSNGCSGFAKNIMLWPIDLITGGIDKNHLNHLTKAEALQSIFIIVSPNDLHIRYKNGNRVLLKENLNSTMWNVEMAEKVIKTWQRNFTANLYSHKYNFDSENKTFRRVHPLASSSFSDILDDFCQFNYSVIFIGYVLMLLYAVLAEARHDGWMLSVDSCVFLSISGIIVITFASISGLGLSILINVNFNATTTQIIPFLTLGIGVDNMFLLLNSYRRVVKNNKSNEIGILLKETGMSIMISSINNILSFLTAAMLPIPALRNFAIQISLLLAYNLIAMLTLYPAIISIDLRRRKRHLRDICCCCVGHRLSSNNYYCNIDARRNSSKRVMDIGDVNGTGNAVDGYSDSLNGEDCSTDLKPFTLQTFLHYCYIPFLKHKISKIAVFLICTGMFLSGLYGINEIVYGLEFSDIMPDNTPEAEFLRARNEYFSFYPMYAVIKGHNVDFAKEQHKIDKYIHDIGQSKYIIKTNQEVNVKYWMNLMRQWLRQMQAELDLSITNKLINVTDLMVLNTTSSLSKYSDEIQIAIRLYCSYGTNFSCSERVGKIRLINEFSEINQEAFYNFITAWYNFDAMMYHLSQASFTPIPVHYELIDGSNFIPPSKPFLHSQVPFYLTGLSNTTVIIDMIKGIRLISDEYTREGVPNFPSGVTFTFWEQYIFLSSYLLKAVIIISCAVFLTVSIILCNPWAAGIVMVILLSITVELAGFLGLAHIKLNAISAATIITAVGIGVEFTIHVILAFITTLGSRNERMEACIERIFIPVIHGALSTLLGITMLAFSKFEFIFKYFFIIMFALIIISMINCLVLLPVLLSVVGPTSEIAPVTKSEKFKASSNLKRNDTQSHRRNISDDSNATTLGAGVENCSTVLLINPNKNSNRAPRIITNTHARSISDHIAR